MIKCPYCMSEMGWEQTFNYDEVYGSGEGSVAFYSCSNDECNAIGKFIIKEDD